MTDLNQHAVAAVSLGAAVLDEYYPDWLQRVNRDKLQISSCSACVLGQLGGGEERSYADMTAELAECIDAEDSHWEETYGFDTDYQNYSYDDLTDAWKDLIDKRRAEVSA